MIIEQPAIWLRWIYPRATWRMDKNVKAVYLTFDDGPIPEATPFILKTLADFNIKATFFMVGDNVKKHPELFKQVVNAGHRIGNHTFNHYGGFKHTVHGYMKNAEKANELLHTNLFRPLAEDFDVFITGANPPKSDRIKDMIGSLKCSIYIKKEDGTVKEHEIANVSGLSHEWKKKMAAVDIETGKICLNSEYEGKVIAINGLALTQSNLKFQHATLKDNGKIEFKAKNPSECVWDEAVLKEMTLTRGH